MEEIKSICKGMIEEIEDNPELFHDSINYELIDAFKSIIDICNEDVNSRRQGKPR